MRLLLVTQDFPPAVGGIQTYCHALADCFMRRCNEFGVVAPLERGSRSIDAALPYPVYRIPVPRNVMRWSLAPFLGRICKRGNYGTALLAQWYSGAATRAFRHGPSPLTVYAAAHGQELLRVPSENTWMGDAYVRHRTKVLASIDGFFPVSHFTGSLLTNLGVPQRKVHVVPNGTDLNRFALSEHEQLALDSWRRERGLGGGPLLLTAARLVRRKGVDIVLRALPEILRQVPDARYAIVGEGPERGPLERLAKELGVDAHVAFLGRLPHREVAYAYNACDVFVMPARFEAPSVEGFGLVFREANSCEKPVIGTTTGGIVDAIGNEETGLLVEPDDVPAFARAVLRLLNDPHLARTLGRRGRALLERSGTWEHAADEMMSVMQQRDAARD